MPKSKSKLGLSQRRERAYELMAKGWTNAAIARDLGVHVDTITGYRRKYEESLHAQAAANPNFLRDVLTNTIRSLTELDMIRADAWKHMEDRTIRTPVTCPHCEEEFTLKERIEVSDETRARYHGILLKAQDQRAKLFGVLGVKQEVFIAIMQVKVVQDKILEWLATNVQGDLRESLATFLETELSEYMGTANPLTAIDTTAIEAMSRAS